MSDPISRQSEYDSERSGFLRWFLSWDSIADGWLYIPAIAIGVGVAFLEASWGLGMAAGFVAYVVLVVAYSALARRHGWRRINWEVFFWNLLGW